MYKAIYKLLPIFFILWVLLLLNSSAHASTYIKGPALIQEGTVIVKAAGTTTLTKDSQTYQQFTGTSTQTVVLPNATTLPQGRQFVIVNAGASGIVDIQDAGGNVIGSVGGASSQAVYLSSNGSINGTWYVAANSIPSNFTSGSVIFADGSGTLAQDNANFYWDDANNRLGISTSAPASTLSFGGDAARTVSVDRSSSGSGNNLTISAGSAATGSTDGSGGTLSIRSGTSSGTGAGTITFFTSPASSTSGTTANTLTQRAVINGNGFLGLGIASPTAQLHLAGGISSAAWGSTGIGLVTGSQTFTDTTSTGSPSIVIHNISQPTVAASNSITPSTTTLRIAGAPADGTNVVSSSKFALVVATGNTRFAGFNYFGANSGSPVSVVGLTGSQSDTSWTTVGKMFSVGNATLTDTTGTGTIATRAANSFGAITLASSGTVTLTDASNLYILRPPSAGTNTTVTNSYGIQIDTGSITATNGYGMKVAAPTGATNNYAAAFTGTSGFGAVTDPGTFVTTSASALTAFNNEQYEARSARAAIVSGNLIGGMVFRSNDTNLTAPGTSVAAIDAVAEATHTASVLDTGISFYTTQTLASSEKMRLSASGNLGIGTSTPANKVQVNNSASIPTYQQFTNGATGSTSSDGLLVGTDLSGNAVISQQESLPINMLISNAVRLSIAQTTGDVSISSTTDASSTTTGSIVASGGIGIGGSAYIGGAVVATSSLIGSRLVNSACLISASGTVSVSTCSIVQCSTASNGLSINNLSNGADGQIVQIYKSSSANICTVVANNSTGGQQILTRTNSNIVLGAGGYGGVTLIYRSGTSSWYTIDN